jgi:hypothetical protein
MKADYNKILLTGEDRPDLYSVHTILNVAPMVKPAIQVEFHGVPINYPVGETFEACDTSIIPISQLSVPAFEFEYGVEKNNFIARYNDSTDIENSTLASFEIKDSQGITHWINYKLFGAVPTGNVIEGNKIKYIEVMPDIDLEYVTDTWRLKENIIIKNEKDNYRYPFTLKLDSATYLEMQENGSVFFKDITTSEVVYRIEKPYAVDGTGKQTLGVKYYLGKKLYNGIEYDSIEVVIEDAEFINNAVFPITIDPTTTTFSVSASADDGYVIRGGTTWPPNNTTYTVDTTYSELAMVKAKYSDTSWEGTVALLRFNTGSIPDDAVISQAQLLVSPTSYTNTDGRSCVIDYYTFTSITSSCWTNSPSSGALSLALNSTNFSTSRKTFTLNNPTNINKTGYTGFRMGISGTSAPTGGNSCGICSQNHSTSANRPQLRITYNVPPSMPILTTPNGGETYNESCNITWDASADPDSDTLTYEIDYSPDNAATWYNITTAVTETNYIWDTSALVVGSTYLVRIRAYDGVVYSNYDQSDGVFTIQHITDKVNINDVLKEVDKRYVNISGTLKEIDLIQVNINGTLKNT